MDTITETKQLASDLRTAGAGHDEIMVYVRFYTALQAEFASNVRLYYVVNTCGEALLTVQINEGRYYASVDVSWYGLRVFPETTYATQVALDLVHAMAERMFLRQGEKK